MELDDTARRVPHREVVSSGEIFKGLQKKVIL
jgi:hypothetical protein